MDLTTTALGLLSATGVGLGSWGLGSAVKHEREIGEVKQRQDDEAHSTAAQRAEDLAQRVRMEAKLDRIIEKVLGGQS